MSFSLEAPDFPGMAFSIDRLRLWASWSTFSVPWPRIRTCPWDRRWRLWWWAQALGSFFRISIAHWPCSWSPEGCAGCFPRSRPGTCWNRNANRALTKTIGICFWGPCNRWTRLRHRTLGTYTLFAIDHSSGKSWSLFFCAHRIDTFSSPSVTKIIT